MEYQMVAVISILLILTIATVVLETKRAKYQKLVHDLKMFKLAVDNASDHIVITDAQGTVLYANKAVEKITGYSVEEIIGQKTGTKALWGGLMDKAFYQKLWTTIKKKRRVFKGEILNRRKNGEIYEAAANITAITNHKKEILFFVGIERDITLEKEIERTKTEFVSLASHQLRTPLTSVNWYAEMLLEGDAGNLNPDQGKYVEEIYAGSQRMLELVDSFLNISSIELGKFSVQPQKCDIRDIAQEAIQEQEGAIQEKSIKIEEHYDSKIPRMSLDKKLTHLIFQNLISNAVKYTPEKGTVTVSLKKDKKNITITVSDTGVGIPKKQQHLVFTKLFRGENVTRKETQGTGLGMYIVKSVLDYIGGSIDFISQEGEGTTFTVRIPRKGMPRKQGSIKLSSTSV
jgi:PAS domain S-box-containing protein